MEGYPARSVYKLQEINEKHKLIAPGMSVVDLGCCPGSWSKYALQQTSTSGSVIGIDREDRMDADILKTAASTFRFVQSDVCKWEVEDALKNKVDVVLSDMAPSTTGDTATAVSDSNVLCLHALRVADVLLSTKNKKGAVVFKIFQGKGFEEVLKRVRGAYKTVKCVTPSAVRKGSRECFIVGLHRRKRAVASDEVEIMMGRKADPEDRGNDED